MERSGNRERETKGAQVPRGKGADGGRSTQKAQIHWIRPTVGREGVGFVMGGERVGSDTQERGWGGSQYTRESNPGGRGLDSSTTVFSLVPRLIIAYVDE